MKFSCALKRLIKRTGFPGRVGDYVDEAMTFFLKRTVGIDLARFQLGEELGGRQGILDTRDHLPEEAKLFLNLSFAKLVLDP